MRFLGKVTTFLLGASAVAGVVLGLRSLPDIKRYLRIRAM